MSMMLGDMAVEAVVKYINASLNDISGLNFEGLAYKYERPQGMTGEYIAVNHLPFVRKNVVGEGIVNINIHVPETETHLPDTKRLSTLVQVVAELFPEGTYLGNKAYYEFYADSRPTQDSDKTYYVNIQLQVIFNNLNS